MKASADGAVGDTGDPASLCRAMEGIPMPRLTIGRVPTTTLARLMTWWAGITRKPPLMPPDLMRTVFRGPLLFDGNAAAASLGLVYTPIRTALADAVADARAL